MVDQVVGPAYIRRQVAHARELPIGALDEGTESTVGIVGAGVGRHGRGEERRGGMRFLNCDAREVMLFFRAVSGYREGAVGKERGNWGGNGQFGNFEKSVCL